jgi:hypothetical protein
MELVAMEYTALSEAEQADFSDAEGTVAAYLTQ